MKRAIYVGPPKSFWTGAFGLDFGATGEVQPVVCAVKGKRWCFWADGCDGLGMHFLLKREDVYIPSEDQTRHCPKPNVYIMVCDVVHHVVATFPRKQAGITPANPGHWESIKS